MSKKRVLLVVDYQNDFVDGALGFESAKSLDDGISTLMKEYAADENGVVICTFDTHYDNYLETQEGKNLPVPHCLFDTNGWGLYGKVGEVASEIADTTPTEYYEISKPTFGSTDLMLSLLDLDKVSGVESITIAGVVTNMCVISNAVVAKAACPEAKIIIKKDLCDSFDKELHQKSLDVMASMQMVIE